MTETITAFKGFDKDLQCRGFQYQVGQTYTHTGKLKVCESGFHACENPLDVLDYYPLDADTRFAVVKASGEIQREGNKLASASITVEAELKLPEFIGAAISYLKSVCNFDSKPVDCASGDYSTLAASGDYSKLAASGDYSTLAASGYSSTLAASGDYSTLAASGDYSKLAASGYSSKLAASGKDSIAVSVGVGGKAKAAEGGCIALRWTKDLKPRLAVAYVGEDGIKADTWYALDDDGNFVEA